MILSSQKNQHRHIDILRENNLIFLFFQEGLQATDVKAQGTFSKIDSIKLEVMQDLTILWLEKYLTFPET